jgi:hypothetical protein
MGLQISRCHYPEVAEETDIWSDPKTSWRVTEEVSGTKGIRWALLKDGRNLNVSQSADLDALIAQVTTKRIAKAWSYREQLSDILERKQIAMLWQWCANVMRF